MHDSLNRAQELVKEGYGLIIIFPHFSMRDAVDMMGFTARQPVFIERLITSPIARHIFDSLRFIIDPVTKIGSIDMYPVVNEDTKTKKKHREKYKDVPEGEGMRPYLRAAVKTLKEGGIVPVAVQTGRRSHLYENGIKKSLSGLARMVGREGFKKYAVLFVGLEHPGIEDYATEEEKFNPFKKYRVNVGRLFTAEQIAQLAVEDIDVWAYSQLEPFVPKQYRKRPIPTPSSPGV